MALVVTYATGALAALWFFRTRFGPICHRPGALVRLALVTIAWPAVVAALVIAAPVWALRWWRRR